MLVKSVVETLVITAKIEASDVRGNRVLLRGFIAATYSHVIGFVMSGVYDEELGAECRTRLET